MTTEQGVREALRTVTDPEIGINIVDLGLVYGIEVSGNDIRIELTMTTQACPLHEYIAEQARAAVQQAAPEAVLVDIKMVWDPPWHPGMMSASAKQQMGWSD